MRILLGEGNVLSLSGEQREIPRTLVYILEGKSASEMASLTFSKFHFPELSRLNLVLLLLNISPIGLKSLLHWPWYWARGSKRVAEEGADVFHDSYNQFISGASSGTAWSLHNSSASDQGEKKKKNNVISQSPCGSPSWKQFSCTETKTNSRAWLKGKHSWLVFNFLIPSHNWKIVKQSFSFFSFLFLLFQFPLYESFFIAAEKVREGKATMPGNIMLVSVECSNSDG